MKKMVFWGVAIFQMVLVIVMLFFLPDKVPMHFDLFGQIDRWGSKYELFVIVALTLICLVLLYSLVYKSEIKLEKDYLDADKRKELQRQVNILLYSGIGFEVLMTFFIVFSGLKSVQTEETINSKENILQSFGILSGSILIILGILLFFIKKNSVIGIRTKWSLKNELTWKYSQRYSAVVFLIAGLGNILISIFYHGEYLLILIVVISIIANMYCIYLTKKMYLKYGE